MRPLACVAAEVGTFASWANCIGHRASAAIAQLAARRSHNPKVVSSILTRRTHCFSNLNSGHFVSDIEARKQLPKKLIRLRRIFQPTPSGLRKASRGFEPRSLDSESRVLTVTPRGRVVQRNPKRAKVRGHGWLCILAPRTTNNSGAWFRSTDLWVMSPTR